MKHKPNPVFERQEHTKHRRWLIAAVSLAFLLASCGGGGDAAPSNNETGDTEIADENSAPVNEEQPAPTTTAPAPTTTVAALETEPDESILVERVTVDELSAGPASFSAAGGISVELPESVMAIQSQRCLVITDASYTGTSPFAPGLAIGVAEFVGRNEISPISTVDEWLSSYEGQPEPVSTGETITLLGEDLEGYRIDGAFADESGPDESVLSCAVDGQTVSDLQIFAAVYSDLFVAETQDGLLVAVANGFTEQEQVRGRELFDAIVPTVEADASAADSIVETSQVEPIVVEQRDAGINQVDPLGGLEFELLDMTTVVTSGNCLLIEIPGYTGSSPFVPNIGVSLIVSSGLPPGDVVPLSTIDEFLALYGDEPAPQATGQTLNLLGEELQAFEVEGAFAGGPPPRESLLNCGSRPGVSSDFGFINAPYGTEFVAETEDGLLTAGFGAFTPEEAEMARELFEQVIPTVTSR